MSRSLGSDGIRLYCDASVALTIVFTTVIAMVAAVIVGSNSLNFSVAIIALVLTGPIPLFACSAADANQRHLSAIDPFRRLSPSVNLDPQLEHHN
jgi:ABC-type transport system involved in cytochrome c biogenesis permease component